MLLTLALLPLIFTAALSSPSPSHHVPLKVLKSRQYSDNLAERQGWLLGQAKSLRVKYEPLLNERGQRMLKKDRVEFELRKRARAFEGRSMGSIILTDVSEDASYCGLVSIGSNHSQFLVIMDSGSADLWVAGAGCQADFCEQSTASTFDPSSSTTWTTNNEPFNISYGSGDAGGYLGTDDVEMGGFTVADQTFALVTDTTDNISTAPMSGIMGLAFQKLSSTNIKPWWQTLADSGTWDTAEMGVYMKRYRDNDTASSVEDDGGEIIFGGIDSSKFDGSLNYIDIKDSDQDYWRLPLESMTVQGVNVDIQTTTDQNPQCAIDTGTTLIGVPSTAAESIYAQISGSEEISSAVLGVSGYYQYPCSTDTTISLAFGGHNYSLSTADMNLGSFTTDTSMCTGAFFVQELAASSPVQWIVGASFLKNVYTSFRYSPTAIGFAPLSSSTNSSTGTNSTTSLNSTSTYPSTVRRSSSVTADVTAAAARSSSSFGDAAKTEIHWSAVLLGSVLCSAWIQCAHR